MKAVILGLVLSICFFASIGQVSFGVKGGLNLNVVSYTNLPPGAIDDFQFSSGFHFGFYSLIALNDHFFFIPEVQYSQRGFTLISAYSPLDVKLNYIEIPLNLSYSLIKPLNLDFGLNTALKVHESGVIDLFNKFNFGLTSGLRFKLTKELTVIGRYYYGLVSIGELGYFDVSGNQLKSNMFNRHIQFSLCYKVF